MPPYAELFNPSLDTFMPTALLICLLAAAPQAAVSAPPKLQNGVPAYPRCRSWRSPARRTRFLRLAGKAIDIQDDFGYPAGFSGFVDAAIGSVGYPGYRNFSNLEIAYDAEKLCLLVCVPYPCGRKTRAEATGPSDALAADDVFEVLIDPRDDQGRSKGPVYRIVGNAGGVCKIDRDLPQIGQPHQPWQAAVKCGSMMWDPMGSWMAAVQIPVPRPRRCAQGRRRLGLPGRDPLCRSENHRRALALGRLRGDRPASPACVSTPGGGPIIAAIGCARTRSGTGLFCVGGIFSNGGNEPAWFDGSVTLFKGDRPLGSGTFAHAAKPLSKYDGDMEPCRLPSQPSGPNERDTVARIVVTDRQAKCVGVRPVCALLADGAGRAGLAEAAFRQGVRLSSRPLSVVRRDRLRDRLPDAHGGPARGRNGPW